MEKLILENQILIMKGLISIGDEEILEEMRKQIKKTEEEIQKL
jgi:hypothetical protein